MPIGLSRIPPLILRPRRNFIILSRTMALLRNTSRQIPSDMKIELTEVENQLCTLLDECCTDLKESKGLDTSCRIAGGWVRDKVSL
jgi:tRNA nucleotidyltransferase (CCA-adding enzyme)